MSQVGHVSSGMAQQQIAVQDLDLAQLSDVRRQLEEVRYCGKLRIKS